MNSKVRKLRAELVERRQRAERGCIEAGDRNDQYSSIAASAREEAFRDAIALLDGVCTEDETPAEEGSGAFVVRVVARAQQLFAHRAPKDITISPGPDMNRREFALLYSIVEALAKE